MAAKNSNSNGSLHLEFEEDRETKGTFRFAERLADELDEAKVGTLYLRKSALKELGWTPGEVLEVEISRS